MSSDNCCYDESTHTCCCCIDGKRCCEDACCCCSGDCIEDCDSRCPGGGCNTFDECYTCICRTCFCEYFCSRCCGTDYCTFEYSTNRFPLHRAIERGDSSKVNRLFLGKNERARITLATEHESVKHTRTFYGCCCTYGCLAVPVVGWAISGIIWYRGGCEPLCREQDTPLVIAARRRNVHMINSLLEMGADPYRLVRGVYPIDYTILYSYGAHQQECQDALINAMLTPPATEGSRLLGNVDSPQKIEFIPRAAQMKTSEIHKLYQEKKYDEVVKKITLFIQKLRQTESLKHLKNNDIQTFYLFRAYSYYYLEQYNQAIEDFSGVIQNYRYFNINGNTLPALKVDLFYHRAKAYQLSNEEGLAQQNFEAVVGIDGNHIEAHRELAEIYYKNNQFLHLKIACNHLIRLEPQNKNHYYYLGISYQHISQTASAIQAFERSLNIDPNYLESYSKLYELYFKSNEFEKAERTAEQLIRLAGEKPEYYFYLGETQYQLQEYSKARDSFSRAIALNINSTKCYFLRGECYLAMNHLEAAEADYRKVIELSPDYDQILNRLYHVRTKLADHKRVEESYTSAIDLYSQAIELDPTNPELFERRAHCYREIGKFEEAIQDLTIVLKRHSQRPDIYIQRGQVYLKPQDYQKALEDFTQAARLGSNDVETYSGLGIANFQLENYPEAIVALEKASTFSSNEELKEMLIFSYKAVIKQKFEDSQYQLVIQNCNKLTHYQQRDSFIHRFQGLAYFKLDQFEEAISNFTAALNTTPKDRKIYCYRARAYQQLHRHAEAISDCVSAIQINPKGLKSYFIKIECHLVLDQLQEAIETHRSAMQLNYHQTTSYFLKPHCTEILSKLLGAYITVDDQAATLAQHYTSAIDLYSQAIELDSTNTKLFEQRAHCYKGVKKFQEAIQDLTIVLKSQPTRSDMYIQRGQTHLKTQEYKKALEDFTQASSLGADSLEINSGIGIANFYLGNHLEAILELEKTCAFNSNLGLKEMFISAYKAFIQQNFEASQYQLVIQNCNKLTQYQQNDLFVHRFQGLAYFKLDQFEEAISNFTTVLNKTPADIEVYYYRALACQKLGQHAEAISDCGTAFKINQKDLKFYFIKIESYLELDQPKEAIEEHRLALRLDYDGTISYFSEPRHVDILEKLLSAYILLGNRAETLAQYKEAVNFYTDASKLAPENYYVFYHIGICQVKLENHPQAIQTLTKAIQLKNDLSEAYLLRALSYNEINEFEKARLDFEAAKDLGISSAELYLGLSFALYSLRQLTPAIEILTQNKEEILKTPKGKNLWLLAHMARGQKYLAAQEYKTAEFDYTQVIGQHPTHVAAYQARVSAYEKLQIQENVLEDDRRSYCEAATADYTILLESYPQEALYYYQRGVNFAKLGQYDDALKDFEAALFSDPRRIEWLFAQGRALYCLERYLDALQVFQQINQDSSNDLDAHFHQGLCFEKLGEQRKLPEVKNRDWRKAQAIFLEVGEKSELFLINRRDLIDQCDEALVRIEKHLKSLSSSAHSQDDESTSDTASTVGVESISSVSSSVFYAQGRSDMPGRQLNANYTNSSASRSPSPT